MRKHIIDLSHHNTVDDWQAMCDNVDGFILRCGHGINGVDRKFNDFVKMVSGNGKPFGIYLYSDSIDAQISKDEIDRLISVGKAVDAKFVALDCEIDKSKYVLNESIRYFLAKKDFAGKKFWYTYQSMFQNYDGEIKSLLESNNLDLWIARYNTVPPTVFCTMWQFTNNYAVINNGTYDCSYIGEAAYQYYFGSAEEEETEKELTKEYHVYESPVAGDGSKTYKIEVWE